MLEYLGKKCASFVTAYQAQKAREIEAENREKQFVLLRNECQRLVAVEQKLLMVVDERASLQRHIARAGVQLAELAEKSATSVAIVNGFEIAKACKHLETLEIDNTNSRRVRAWCCMCGALETGDESGISWLPTGLLR